MQVNLDTARLELDLATARAEHAEQHAARVEAALQAGNQGMAAQQQELRETQDR